MPKEFTLHEETERTDALVAELAELWERSVRAAHDFLAEGGVEFYKPYAVEAIKSLPLVITARADGKAAAFMGITGAHLDALFAAPEYFGRGAGAALMREALAAASAPSTSTNKTPAPAASTKNTASKPPAAAKPTTAATPTRYCGWSCRRKRTDDGKRATPAL